MSGSSASRAPGRPSSLRAQLDLSIPPSDDRRARNYRRLYELRRDLADALEKEEQPSRSDFRRWETEVLSLLWDAEKDRFLRSPTPHEPTTIESEQQARLHHLTEILWARKGLGSDEWQPF